MAGGLRIPTEEYRQRQRLRRAYASFLRRFESGAFALGVSIRHTASHMDTTGGALLPPSPEPIPAISGRRIDWTPRDVLIGVLLLVGALWLPQIPLIPLGLAIDTESRGFLLPAMAVTALTYVAIAAVAARMTFLKYGGGWERLGVRGINGRTLAWAGGAFVAALVVSYAYAIFVDQYATFLKQGCEDQVPGFIRHDALILALASFAAVVCAPAAEELFFRGFAFPGLARAWGAPAGIVLSGLLFGSAHLLGNPVLYKSLIQFAAIGMVFAFTYWKSGNIFASMLAHFTFNLLGVISLAATTCHN